MFDLSKKILIILGMSFLFSSAAIAYNEALYEKSTKLLEEKISLINNKKYTSEDLAEWTRLAIDIKSASEVCVAEKNNVLQDLNESIKNIGEAIKGEDENVSTARSLIINDKNKVEKIIADCNAHLLSVNEIEKKLDKAKSHDLDRVYFTKQQNVVVLIASFINNPTKLFSDSSNFFIEHSGIKNIEIIEWITGFFVLLIVLFLALKIKNALKNIIDNNHWNDDLDSLLMHSALTVGGRYLPYVMVSLFSYLMLVYINFDTKQNLFITQVAMAITLYFSCVSITCFILSPIAPAKPILKGMGDILLKISHRLRVLYIITLIGYLSFYTIFSENLTETNLELLRYIFSFFMVINLIWTIRVLIDPKKLPKISWISRFVNLILILTLIVEWNGYTNLSIAVRAGALISFILLMAIFGTSKIFQHVFNSLDSGSNKLCQSIRKKLAVENGDVIPGLIWIRMTISVVLWGGFIVILVNIWDVNGGVLTHLKDYILNGFLVGESRVIPIKIIMAFILFSALLAVTGFLKKQLEKNWLNMLNIDSGARDAVVTIAGYLMFLIALLIGLSAAGFNFGNIAIVAGALSVGIGFGLQNIVNNFVSGLILLFERPIRKGDWVQVGSTEGFVKNIQIRSTLIRTFDNSDVIVPNSELISNQVTNWMLSSKKGRAIVPVGVAYGSDIEQVRDVLLKVAEDNDMLIHGENRWTPKVLFRGFGDSSLDFELRVFLKEINGRLMVISDLNFAIDKAFRAANIEIPFPQRDVHVKSIVNKED